MSSSASFTATRHFFYEVNTDTVLSSTTETVSPYDFGSTVHPDLSGDDESPPGADELFEVRYNLHQYPQISTTPDVTELKYEGPLLQRLAALHIVTYGRSFSQSAAQQTSWQWLESTLCHGISALSSKYELILPLKVRMFPLPSHYGYLRRHKSHAYALRSAKNSRLAFHGLLGMLHLVHGYAQRRYELNVTSLKPLPSPSDVLLQSGLSDSHIRDIITTLQPETLGRCVGVVIDPRVCQWPHLIPTLILLGVPFWVIVGTQGGPFHSQHHLFTPFMPTTEDNMRIKTTINTAISKATPSDDTNLSPGDISPNSMRRWLSLLQMREEKRAKFLAGASDAVKQRLQQRLEKARAFVFPTQPDGTRFFVWYRSKHGRYRGEIECGDAKFELETRGGGQFKYDELCNEWDICTLFEPELPEPADASDTADFELDTMPEVNTAVDISAARPTISNAPHLPSAHNELGREILYNREIREDIVLFKSLEDVLCSRYGLTCRKKSAIQSEHDYAAIIDPQLLDLFAVRKYLMEMHLPLDSINHEFAIRHFVSSLIQDGRPASIVWDLDPANVNDLVASNKYFHCKLVKDNSCSGYVILPCDEKYSRSWHLIITSSISVVQCIREQWGPSLEDIILCLTQRGIDFRVVLPIPPGFEPKPCPRTVFESLRRPVGWFPDKYEYVEYERRRNQLLKLARIRAVVVQGGILWRLCKMALDSVIFSGPSNDVHSVSDRLSDAPTRYLLDTLSNDEIDTVCGVYHVNTGSRANQVAILSWWPTPSQWKASGLDVGYWTHSAEHIFQKRLDLIRQGKADLKSGRQWRSELSYYKGQTKKLIHAVERECTAVIERFSQ